MELKYENPDVALAPNGTSVTPQYSGNISQVVWQVKGREKQAYTLKYDALNRMTDAIYSDINANNTVVGNRFDEKLTYDSRGNINTLKRWGLTSTCTWGMIDNLVYNYGSTGYNIKNQLQSVTDNSDLAKGYKTVANGSTYTYDTNGNVTSDLNKGITNISYNHMNLPIIITYSNGNKIEFMYDAGGNKLRKKVSGTTNYVQNYIGGIEYKDGVLEAIYHTEGRIIPINGVMKYEYALKDYLGNTRLMFSDIDGDGKITQATNEVTQEIHYTPFGLNLEGVWSNSTLVTDNKYLFSGKEVTDDFGLGWNDHGARNYDPTIVRWTTYDPKADMYAAYSPYNYVVNNPMRFVDPNGMDPIPLPAFGANGRDMNGNTQVQGGGIDENGNVRGTSKGGGLKATTTITKSIGGVDISTTVVVREIESIDVFTLFEKKLRESDFGYTQEIAASVIYKPAEKSYTGYLIFGGEGIGITIQNGVATLASSNGLGEYVKDKLVGVPAKGVSGLAKIGIDIFNDNLTLVISGLSLFKAIDHNSAPFIYTLGTSALQKMSSGIEKGETNVGLLHDGIRIMNTTPFTLGKSFRHKATIMDIRFK
jgi:RHS repeat-associated protein